MKFFVVSDNTDTLTGMRLAGISGVLAHTPDEVRDALQEALADKSIGILLITEKLVNVSPDLIGDIRTKRKTPLLVVIPDRHGTGRAPDSITRYVRDAIGIKIE